MASKKAGESHFINSLITKRESRWIGRVTSHSDVILFGGGNDLFQKVRDALPIVLMGYSAFVSNRNILPIIFQLERIARGASAPSGLPVPAIRNHFTVIGNDFHADVGCFPNITDNDVNLVIPFGS